jgi:hypothetical protein
MLGGKTHSLFYAFYEKYIMRKVYAFEMQCGLCVRSCFRLYHIRRLADTILDKVEHKCKHKYALSFCAVMLRKTVCS